jgi:hypothetical protein
MKTIALSMIFSLVVIVCEQQTLFAPHYTDFGGRLAVTSKTSPQNSLVPVAGANRLVPSGIAKTGWDIGPVGSNDRLVPVAGANRLVPGGIAKTGWDVGPVGSSALDSGDCTSDFDPTAPVNGVSMYDDIRGGQEGEDIVDSYQFLPWHRG